MAFASVLDPVSGAGGSSSAVWIARSQRSTASLGRPAATFRFAAATSVSAHWRRVSFEPFAERPLEAVQRAVSRQVRESSSL